LEERDRFIESEPYSEDNYEMLEKLMGNSDKMWERYKKCLKDVEDEKAHISGGAMESLGEQNII